ncbi:MAG TPA: DUF3604 domain-containing protein [Myxococcota bacterium]|nr:DUF3604 domain-containing protein [Myxococcota bacterium]
MRVLIRVAVALVLLVAVCVGLLWLAGRGALGRHEGPGEPAAASRPAAALAAEAERGRSAAEGVGASRAKQILFGDLHVHTTFSADAFLTSLPLGVGEGAHPPADACDFARFCSSLDFWSINDHAEAISPRHWRETVEAIRQCNAVSGDPENPDTVAFLGWEWTQVGTTPVDHYGHKNVVLRSLEPDEVPTRPIAAAGTLRNAMNQGGRVLGRGLVALLGDARTRDFMTYVTELETRVPCAEGVPVRELPADCLETAETPADLFARLDDWGVDSIVIPHGTTWGFYTPPGSTWDKQLEGAQHDPDRQTLIEVYSGHGNSEEWRDYRAVDFDPTGRPSCPEPTRDYLPTCWRAGEIVRERCAAGGEAPEECERRAVVARGHAAEALGQAHLTVPGTGPREWLDAGQCRNCTLPAFNYRPGGSAQYILALSGFEGGAPRRFRFGFIASSDNHFARPGTGYKDVHRRGFTESDRIGRREGLLASVLAVPEEQPAAASRPFDRAANVFSPFQLAELERQTSFFTTGGLVAVHSDGRGRDAIWQALERKEVYGTSGPRILLWFDLLNPPGSAGATAPMGSEVRLRANPIFQARAVGSFEQLPGCPDASRESLGDEDLERICKGECYHPGAARRRITRLEVVRIRPQGRPGEAVSQLVEDPWRTFACEPRETGCVVTFEDASFAAGARDAVYYVRAMEEPAPKVNGAQLRCTRDPEGRCTRVDLCGEPGEDRDDCLGDFEARAWSSPIYVDFAGDDALVARASVGGREAPALARRAHGGAKQDTGTSSR